MSLPKAKTVQRLIITKEEKRTFTGPPIEGQVGSGTIEFLNSAEWGLLVTEDDELKFYKYTVGPDEYVETAPLSPHDPFFDTAINVTAQFDQSARFAIAGEGEEGSPEDSQIFVSQWNPTLTQYVLRGPFSGHTPVLFNDTSLAGQNDSDVVLFYMSLDRLTIHYRLQRDNYAIEYTYLVIPDIGVQYYLNQAVEINGGLLELALWVSDNTETFVTSAPYPRSIEDNSNFAMSILNGEWFEKLVAKDINDTARFGMQLLNGNWNQILISHNVGEDKAAFGMVLLNGNWFEVLKEHSLEEDKSRFRMQLLNGSWEEKLFLYNQNDTTRFGMSLLSGSWDAVP